MGNGFRPSYGDLEAFAVNLTDLNFMQARNRFVISDIGVLQEIKNKLRSNNKILSDPEVQARFIFPLEDR